MKKVIILLLMAISRFCFAQENFKMSDLVFTPGVSYMVGPVTLTRVLENTTASSRQGDVDAQYNLGTMYKRGRGVTQDDAEVAGWYRKVAEQESVLVQYFNGVMYEHSNGIVAPDYAKAVECYRKAAVQGDAKAQCNLGVMYYYGAGVEKNEAKANEWINKATMQIKEDDESSQNSLAYSLNAIGNYEKALTYITLAIGKRPNEASYLDTYADTLIGLGRYDEAMSVIEKAKQNELSEVVLSFLAMRETAILVARNDYAKALVTFATIDTAKFGVYEKSTYAYLVSAHKNAELI